MESGPDGGSWRGRLAGAAVLSFVLVLMTIFSGSASPPFTALVRIFVVGTVLWSLLLARARRLVHPADGR